MKNGNLQQIHQDPDYVALKRFDYSLAKTLERYPEGCPPHILANALALTEAEVEAEYQRIVAKLKELVL